MFGFTGKPICASLELARVLGKIATLSHDCKNVVFNYPHESPHSWPTILSEAKIYSVRVI